MKELVAVNGEFFKPEDAKISVFDRGFLYGDSIYEVTRSYGRVLFAMEEHLQRLYRSAERIGLEIGLTHEQLKSEIYRVYDQADMDDVYVRIVITRGEGPINLDPSPSRKPNMVIFVRPVDVPDATVYEKGVDLITATVLRNSKKALDPNIKSGNYLNSVMALGEAKKARAFDAVMVNSQGFVTEGTTWNIFMVKNQTYITPPDDADILQGITRKILRKIGADHHFRWEERFFTAEELKQADEVFTTGSVKEILAVRSVDSTTIGAGCPGPCTLKLASLYKEFVKSYCQKNSR